MTEAGVDAAPILFPIQLVEVHCASVQAEHRAKDEGSGPEEASVQLGVTPLDEKRRTFRARLDVGVSAPAVDDDELAHLLVVVQGTFTSDSDVSGDLYRRYVEFTPVALLWPYARGYIAQAASMLGLALPPLPSLDVLARGRPDETAVDEPTAEA